jgi:branched-chain amino acid transport system substrate-binding protein
MKIRLRTGWMLAALALGSLGTAGAQTRPPYEVNAILSLSGPAAFFGVSSSKTLKVMEDMVNGGGGIGGRPIKIVLWDDQSQPQVAVQLINDLIAKHVPVVIGPSNTAACSAIGPLIAKSGPVGFCVSPFIQVAPGSFFFANGPDMPDNAAVVLRYYRERGLTRFAMLDSTDATGLSADKGFADAFALAENKGLTLVTQQHFAPTDVSVAAQIAQIKAANPQVLIGYTVGSPFQTLVRGMHDGGLDVPIATSAGNMTSVQMTQALSVMPKELDFAAYPSYVDGASVPKVVADQEALFRRTLVAAGIKPDGGYAGVWDMASIVFEALRHLGPDPSAEAVRAYIANLRGWAGITGIYDFRAFPQRGISVGGYIMTRYDPDKSAFIPVSKPGGTLK